MCLCSFLETCSAGALVPVKVSENAAGTFSEVHTGSVRGSTDRGHSCRKGVGPQILQARLYHVLEENVCTGCPMHVSGNQGTLH